MEALLSLAFDNLSSYDGLKIRKGLRQVEGLLAQICLSTPSRSRSSSSPTKPNGHKRSDSKLSPDPSDAPNDEHDGPDRKSLADLGDDPAFREFFKLQEGFEWNVALRLINTLDRLMAKSSDGQNDLLILSALDAIQGVLLLHPPSKSLFSREQYMNLLLDLLEPVNCPAIQSATLLTVVRSPSKLASAFGHKRGHSRADSSVSASARSRAGSESEGTLSTEEKQALLGRHLSSVEDLVKDLRTSTPFGGVL
ncbi:hypothetical protein HYQ45_017230 [Verticillium longisporum]|uniref:Cell division control protein 14 n=1 Tax=Verticillium longisporum TaxID=100787 RepID=A0A8I3AHG2_VERLO|nr:hypothetical protein HYQ45_017230 [Verticillium longisporum]